MTVLELQRQVAAALAAGGIDEAQNEAAILVGHYLGLGRADLHLRAKDAVRGEARAAVAAALERRLERVPLAYVIGEWDFFGRSFLVSPAVLIPRAETELLVEQSLTWLGSGARVLDLGTGSGAIAVTLALECPACRVCAVDLSPAALEMAAANAARYGVREQLALLAADWCTALRRGAGFDLVVSNPPYVARGLAGQLQPEVEQEPATALFGGADGLAAIRRLADEVPGVLRPGGGLIVEIGFDQGESARAEFQRRGCFAGIRVEKDYAGLPRVLSACYKPD